MCCWFCCSFGNQVTFFSCHLFFSLKSTSATESCTHYLFWSCTDMRVHLDLLWFSFLPFLRLVLPLYTRCTVLEIPMALFAVVQSRITSVVRMVLPIPTADFAGMPLKSSTLILSTSFMVPWLCLKATGKTLAPNQDKFLLMALATDKIWDLVWIVEREADTKGLGLLCCFSSCVIHPSHSYSRALTFHAFREKRRG